METKMITYRNLKTEEAQEFWNLMNQLDYETKYMLYEPGERKEKANNIAALESRIRSTLEGDDLLLVAEADNKLVGYISADKGFVNRIAHSAYIVVGILKEYSNRGIGTELFKRLDAWAQEKKMTRLELTVVCENEAAKHLYEKSGFEIEGIKRNSVFVDGRYLDEYYMGKIV